MAARLPVGGQGASLGGQGATLAHQSAIVAMAGWGSIRLGQGAILVRQNAIQASPGGILSRQEAPWPASTIFWLATSRVFGAIWGGS